MGIINAECGKTFRIAYQGENKRQQVRFDLADIMGEFPGGTAVLAVLRNGDADPVPAAETAMDGTALIWTVTAWECALDGFLYAQVTYAAGETVAKTKVYRFDVKNSLVVNGAEPEGWQDLVGQLVTAADGVNSAISAAMDTLDEKVTAAEAAQDAAEDAQEAAETARDEAVAAVGQYDAMTAEATGLAAGDEPTAVIDHTGDHPVLQLGIPKGEKGDTGATGQAGPAGPSGVDGFSPTAGVSKVGKIATITIVDKNGTTTASVSDGADGDPGDIIDDTAGAGDTDKTFSADKLTTMNSELLNAISVLEPAATSSDVGKFLKAKTVSGGKVTEYEFGSGGGSGGTDDYSDLMNKPQINGVTLVGNKSSTDLGLLSGQGVTEAVDDYLEENFSNPSNPPLDRTLSSALSAAPADLVGEVKEKVDYLEDTSGISMTVANLLHTILSEGVYGSDQTANIELLYKATSNIAPISISAVLSDEVTPYVYTPFSDLKFIVTATFDDYSTLIVPNYSVSDGVVASGSNTATITFRGISTTVTFQADSTPVYQISYDLDGVKMSNSKHAVVQNDPYLSDVSTIDPDYYIDEYSITMGGVDITSTAYLNGHISIASVTGNVEIAIKAEEYTYLEPLIQRRPYSTEGDSTTYLYSDEYVTQARNPIAYKHVGRVTEYPAKYDCTLNWTVTNEGENAISLFDLGFGMVSGDKPQYINNNAIAYWEHIDNVSHSLEPGESISGTYNLKAGWQLILTTTVHSTDPAYNTEPVISTRIRGGYVPETFDDYDLLYTITNVSTDFPNIGNYKNSIKWYSDNGTTEIASGQGWLKQIDSNIGPVEYSIVSRVKYDPQISMSTGIMLKTAIGFVDNVNESNVNYAFLAKAKDYSIGANVWVHGTLKATQSNMYLVSSSISSSDSITLEIYGKEVTA